MFLLALGVLGHWIGRSFRLFLVSLLVFSGCWAEEDVTLSHVGAIAGKHWDIVSDVAVDQQGFVYLVGESWSDFIWLGGERQTAGRRGASDAFVVKINPRYFRPTEVDLLIGDPSKAEASLGWKPKTKFKELVSIMVKSDYEKIKTRSS